MGIRSLLICFYYQRFVRRSCFLVLIFGGVGLGDVGCFIGFCVVCARIVYYDWSVHVGVDLSGFTLNGIRKASSQYRRFESAQ